MDMSFRKITNFLLVAVLFYSGFSTSALASSGGISGYSGQTAGMDCSNCHSSNAGGFQPVPMLTGPITVDPGATNTYNLNVQIFEFVAAGLDVAADGGTLVVTDAAGTQILNGELTHTEPRFGLGEVNWSFDWTAPTTPGNYTLYVGVAGVDGAQGNNGDLTAITALAVNVVQGNQPPIAAINGPATAKEGVMVTFDGKGSNDPDGSIFSYEWNFGDGNVGSGETVTHVFAPGTYTVTLKVTDNMGATAEATHQIEIVTLMPPTAAPGGPYASIVGTPIQFDGSSSADMDGQIMTYEWDFGDGATGTGVSPTHTYTAAGAYTVSLTVTDTDNLSNTATTTAEIIALAPPMANVGGPYSGTVGAPVQFDGSGSTDPDGTIVSFAWDFGDGATSDLESPTHTYTAAGTYTVALTVTDNDNQTDTATTTATIVVVPPPKVAPVANAGGPYTGTTGAPVQFNGSGSTDADGQVMTYAWNFGDGNTSTDMNPMHTYIAPGTYTVTLTVTDNDGLASDPASVTSAEIGAVVPPPPPPAPPVADPGGPYMGVVGTPIQFDGSGSSDPDGDTLTYQWDFGDGNIGTGPTPTHTYAAAGSYVGTLTVTDSDGLMTSVEFPVTVVEPVPPAPTEPPPPAPTEPPPPADEPADNPNGAELYGKYCAACHGGNGLGGSAEENVVGAHPTEIMEAIKDDEGGMGALDYLKPEEIQAISDWLRRGLPDPRAEKDLKKRGKKIYKAYCGSCHGKKGAGGSAKSILGEDAEDIMEAKHGSDDEVQKFLAALIDNGDIAALVKYLDYEKDKSDYKSEKEQRKRGKKDYKTYCQSCHGKKGRGEPYSPLIGEDADDIADALTESHKMEHQDRAQRFESKERIESLVVYLNYEYEKYLDKDDDDDDDDDEKDDD